MASYNSVLTGFLKERNIIIFTAREIKDTDTLSITERACNKKENENSEDKDDERPT